MNPRILVACESSGTVRRAFRAIGADAWSCDILPADDGSPFHIQGDAREAVTRGWDCVIAHPSCRYLAVSGMHWTTRGFRDPKLTEDALEFFQAMLDAPAEFVAVENPVSVASSRIRKPDQIIQPNWFGEDASKATCLWLKNLPTLVPTRLVPPRIVNGRKRWANQTDSGQNRLGPSADRWKQRSKTYPGVADAMAIQWMPAIAGRFALS